MKKAIIIGINLRQDKFLFLEELNEIKSLAKMFQIDAAATFTQYASEINQTTYFTKNRLADLQLEQKQNQVDLLLCNNELNITQEINLRKALNIPVIDRTYLLLNYLRKRAGGKCAQLELDLASLKYLLPRIHIENYQTDITKIKSEPLKFIEEQDLSIMKRTVMGKISLLEDKLKDARKKKTHCRKSKLKTVAVTGFMGSGKKSIINVLARNAKTIKDAPLKYQSLYGTANNLKRIKATKHNEFLVLAAPSHFNKLPASIKPVFLACLKEALNVNLILHAIDSHNPNFISQIETVNQSLQEIGIEKKKMFYVFNKIDLLQDYFFIPIPYAKGIKMSTNNKDDVYRLEEMLCKMLSPHAMTRTFAIPKKKQKLINIIKEEGIVLNIKYLDLTYIKVCVNKRFAKRLKKYEIKG